MRINFGDSPFKFGPPPGYTGLSKAPDDVVASAAAAAAASSASNSSRLPLCIVMEPSRWGRGDYEIYEQVLAGEVHTFLFRREGLFLFHRAWGWDAAPALLSELADLCIAVAITL